MITAARSAAPGAAGWLNTNFTRDTCTAALYLLLVLLEVLTSTSTNTSSSQ